jgi:hypothetical protein
VIAVRTVVASRVLAVEAAFGCVGLVDVENMEAVESEKSTQPGGWPWSRIPKIVPRTVTEGHERALSR